jgi:hypothetical protein
MWHPHCAAATRTTATHTTLPPTCTARSTPLAHGISKIRCWFDHHVSAVHRSGLLQECTVFASSTRSGDRSSAAMIEHAGISRQKHAARDHHHRWPKEWIKSPMIGRLTCQCGIRRFMLQQWRYCLPGYGPGFTREGG